MEQTLKKWINLLTELGLTVALVESSTGGYAASSMTAIPGVSKVFKGGFVPYANSIKEEVLDISPELIETYGAVSEEVVRGLAIAGIRLSRADICLAESGILGPGGSTAEKPVGTYCLAMALRSGPKFSKQAQARGSRLEIRAAIVKDMYDWAGELISESRDSWAILQS
ncbi:CinA family protein [Pontibacter sp. G13]|uniref:CinA family protein n=1 Tax=Pontibacter sp. G13 TaxID=3074898 RepID=UPI00288BF085|nr:CinA family protein [Pontibacter sp. G13]WNJ18950.1 CinA family protein [Pontibacter sp. G13]